MFRKFLYVLLMFPFLVCNQTTSKALDVSYYDIVRNFPEFNIRATTPAEQADLGLDPDRTCFWGSYPEGHFPDFLLIFREKDNELYYASFTMKFYGDDDDIDMPDSEQYFNKSALFLKTFAPNCGTDLLKRIEDIRKRGTDIHDSIICADRLAFCRSARCKRIIHDSIICADRLIYVSVDYQKGVVILGVQHS